MAIVDFDTECWDDPFFQGLSPLARYLFIYLWTNTHRNISGMYVITKKTISDETGLTEKQINSLFKNLHPKIKYDDERSICWVIKHTRRQFLRYGKISQRLRQGIRKHVLKLRWHPFFRDYAAAYPEIFLQEEIDTLSNGYGKGMDTLSNGYAEGMDRSGGGGLSSVLDVSSPINAESMDTSKHCVKSEKPTLPEVKTFIDLYYNTFKDRFGQAPIIQGAKDGANVKKLLNKIPFHQLIILLERFFESDDRFIMDSGYTLGVFYSQIQKLMIGKRAARGKSFEAGDLWEKIKGEEDERKRSARLQIADGPGKSHPAEPGKPDA